MNRVAYQGVPGSYSHQVATWYFGESATFTGLHPFGRIFQALKKAEANYGVIPIENTIAGTIYQNYDLLLQHPFDVVAEHKLQIDHKLLALPGTSFSKIKRVYSHPKALEQCDEFFDKHPDIEEVVWHDTAGAAKHVATQKDSTRAAIASSLAAKTYGLEVLRENIQDDPNNWTRFFVISSKPQEIKNADKVSLIFTVAHQPGSLYRAIKVFADARVNMTKIESRAKPQKRTEYYFYVDVEFDHKHINVVRQTVERLREETHFLKVLGYYKKG